MVADPSIDFYRPGRDTCPLKPSELSPTELKIIREIERRIAGIRDLDRPNRRKGEDDYLAHAQQRYRRVFLLDGDRGTGKTSVLTTLVKRWNPPGSKEFDEIVESQRPDFIRVLPILDFDPLPPGMPLAAGIIQAWRPLIDHYEAISRNTSGWSENDGDTLLDVWLKLFRVAAVGWAGIPTQTGLIEQVLDREEQVGNWQRLDRQWYDFVEDVIEFATTRVPQHADPLPKNPIFVIMIDDVDLQVGRVSELLPSLRLLYHPSVVFVVAAHCKHLVDMLALDFLGQQQKLVRTTGVSSPSLWTIADGDRWAGALASSAFQKVFATPDLWRLEPLSLSEWLEFPGEPFTFRGVLNGRGKPLPASSPVEPTHDNEALGDYMQSFARLRQKHGPGAATVMTYRKAQQLADEIFTAKEPGGVTNATTLLCRLLDPSGTNEIAVPSLGDPPDIEFRAVGEVTAMFSPELIEVVYPRLQEIVLSGRPRFMFRAEGEPPLSIDNNRTFTGDMKETAALLALSLQDSHRSVVAPGLRWGSGLSLAWTSWVMNDHSVNAAFRWPLHVLPTPLRLFEWANEWAEFIRKLAAEKKDLRDRMAYGWIYHQLSWLGGSLEEVDEPSIANMNEDDVWERLLKKDPLPDTDSKLGEDRWRRNTIPLLARPEIGLTPRAQKRLLSAASKEQSNKELKDARRRLVRDAFDAAAGKSDRTTTGGEEEANVTAVLLAIDSQYEGAPWYDFINELSPESH